MYYNGVVFRELCVGLRFLCKKDVKKFGLNVIKAVSLQSLFGSAQC